MKIQRERIQFHGFRHSVVSTWRDPDGSWAFESCALTWSAMERGYRSRSEALVAAEAAERALAPAWEIDAQIGSQEPIDVLTS